MTGVPAIPPGWSGWRLRPRGRSAPIVPDASAQEIYAAMIKDVVSPALREQGLVGSGGRYSIKSETHWALLAFQKSWYSDRAEVRFTVNLMVVRCDDWEALLHEHPYYGKKPSATITYNDPVRHVRIGELVDDLEDKWWCVFSGQDMDAVQADLLGDLIDVGVPWLRSQVAETSAR
ncbi:DUF4304 domain-containing protein [Microbacterium sp. NPDC089698]|uniref:DUF4304 domain-containing protein n=1 Tax=Microbacterium sp. NPDC089698 TaxID=3364200 RepID=UPI00380345C4